MKINVTITSAEAAYIQRAIRRFAPNFDQTEMWADMDAQTPAYRSMQTTNSNGNIDASLDINSDFVMDLTDVCTEVAEKAKSFAFMLKGAWEGIKQYGKELSVRFNKWVPEVDALKEAEDNINHFLKDEDSAMDDGDFAAVIVNTDKQSFLSNGSVFVRSHLTHSRYWADLQDMVSNILKKDGLGSNPITFYFVIDKDRAVLIDPEEQIFSSERYKAAHLSSCKAQKEYEADGRPIEEGEMILVSDRGTVKVIESYELDDACTKIFADEPASYVDAFVINNGNPMYAATRSDAIAIKAKEEAHNEALAIKNLISAGYDMIKRRPHYYEGKLVALFHMNDGRISSEVADTIELLQSKLHGSNLRTAYIFKVNNSRLDIIDIMDTVKEDK